MSAAGVFLFKWVIASTAAVRDNPWINARDLKECCIIEAREEGINTEELVAAADGDIEEYFNSLLVAITWPLSNVRHSNRKTVH